MNRRELIFATSAVALGLTPTAMGRINSPIKIEELTLADIADAFADGRLTSRTLTEIYLERINTLNRRGPALFAVIETTRMPLANWPDSIKNCCVRRRAKGV